MTKGEILTQQLRSGGVIKYHATPEIPSQTLAEHQWRCAILYMALFAASPGNLPYILTHDAGEIITGDISSHAEDRQTTDGDAALKHLDDQVAQLTCPALQGGWRMSAKVVNILEGYLYTLDAPPSAERDRILDHWRELGARFNQRHPEVTLVVRRRLALVGLEEITEGLF